MFYCTSEMLDCCIGKIRISLVTTFSKYKDGTRVFQHWRVSYELADNSVVYSDFDDFEDEEPAKTPERAITELFARLLKLCLRKLDSDKELKKRIIKASMSNLPKSQDK